MEEELLIVTAEGTRHVLSPFKIFDEGGLYGLSVNSADDEVGEATVVGLETLGTFSESDKSGERGGGRGLLVRRHAAVGAMPPPLATSYG